MTHNQLSVNPEQLWTAEDEQYIPSQFLPKFLITGIDRRTNREETYKASFGWSLDGLRQVWTIAGHCASHALLNISSAKEIEPDTSINIKSASGSIEVKNNIEFFAALHSCIGDSIAISHKKRSGITHTQWLDVVRHESDPNIPVCLDSYKDEKVSTSNLLELLKVKT